MVQRVRKEILVINDEQSTIEPLLSRFNELSMNQTYLPGKPWVVDLISNSPAFALVFLEGTDIDQDLASKYFRSLDEKDNKTPLVWLSGEQTGEPCVGSRRPDASIRLPFSLSAVQSTVNRLLVTRFFPDVVRNLFTESCTHTMAESFATHVKDIQHYLKADAMSLAPVSAMVSFVGESCQGCVTVSGAAEIFEACHHRLLGDSGLAQPAPSSIAGEICNQVTGHFKTALSAYGLSLRHSFPILVNAHPLSLTYGGPGRLSLVQSLTDGKGDLYIELCFDVFDLMGLSECNEVDSVSSGELMFF
jgi:CheY-specific phosphatase CheX